MKLIVCVMQRHAPNPHSCGKSGGLELAQELERNIAERNLPVEVERKACLSMCLKGPNIQLQPEGRNWHAVTLPDIVEILAYLQHKTT